MVVLSPAIVRSTRAYRRLGQVLPQLLCLDGLPVLLPGEHGVRHRGHIGLGAQMIDSAPCRLRSRQLASKAFELKVVCSDTFSLQLP